MLDIALHKIKGIASLLGFFFLLVFRPFTLVERFDAENTQQRVFLTGQCMAVVGIGILISQATEAFVAPTASHPIASLVVDLAVMVGFWSTLCVATALNYYILKMYNQALTYRSMVIYTLLPGTVTIALAMIAASVWNWYYLFPSYVEADFSDAFLYQRSRLLDQGFDISTFFGHPCWFSSADSVSIDCRTWLIAVQEQHFFPGGAYSGTIVFSVAIGLFYNYFVFMRIMRRKVKVSTWQILKGSAFTGATLGVGPLVVYVRRYLRQRD